MGFFALFLSILAESSAKTIDKVNFARTKTTPRLMMLIIFITMSAAISSYLVITQQPFPSLSLVALGLLGLIGFFSFGGNIFDVLSLKNNDLSLREPLVDFEPIAAGLLAYLLFPQQRNIVYLIAFILGTFITFWGVHRRKLRKAEKKGLMYMWLAVAFYAILPSIYQEALEFMTPSYVAFFRVSIILVLTASFFPPRKIRQTVSTKGVLLAIIAGAIYAIGAVASLYAIDVFGVVLTLLFLMLGPSLRYLSSYFILGEKVRRGEIGSSILLLIVVVFAAIIQ
jgi:drug/metabolite transporter (DMT)-like permease